MSRTATVVIVGGDDAQPVSGALKAEGIAAVAVEGQAAIQALVEGLRAADAAEETVDWVVLLDADLPTDLGFEIYRLLHGERPVPTLTLVRAEKYPELARDPLRPAMDEYATKPARPDELVLRVKALMLRAGFDLPAAPSSSEPGQPELEGMRGGSVITVMSAKGGTGKTTVAVNLADGLVRFYERKTLVVDGDICFGDVGILLNMDSTKSLSDVCYGGDIDVLRLQNALLHHDDGFAVLLRPRELWMTEGLVAATVLRAIMTYKVLFDYVIVDTDTSYGELTVQLLEAADRVMLVTTPEIAALHHTARLLEMADSLGSKNRVSLILNRSGSGVSLGQIEAELGVSVAGTLVSAGRSVVAAANRGVTLFAQDPHTRQEITRNMKAIVDGVVKMEAGSAPAGASEPSSRKAPESRSLLSFLGVRG